MAEAPAGRNVGRSGQPDLATRPVPQPRPDLPGEAHVRDEAWRWGEARRPARGDPWARLRPYRTVLASRARSQTAYRANFVLDLVSSLLAALVELAEVWVLFHAVTRLGGLEFQQMLLVFGLADLAFSLADLIFGHCDRLSEYVRAGTLDVFYLRPQPLLLQLITCDISLRRLARASVGVVALGAGLILNDIAWGASSIALLSVALVSGVAMFSALFVWAAGAQFFLVDGAEMTNAVTYGGRYAATQPASVWSRPLKVVFGFAVPMAFAGFLPTLRLLDLPAPAGFPTWLGWCGPLAALWTWAVALLFWSWGIRHYRSGGG